MEDEAQKGVNSAPVAKGQAADATDQPVVSQLDNGEGVKPQAPPEQAVPYSRFKEVNDAKKAAEDNAATLQAQNDLLLQQAASVPQPQQPTDFYSQTVRSLGYEPTEYLSPEQQGHVFNTMFQAISVSQTDAAFMDAHPDFSQVVGTSDAAGNLITAAPLQRVLAKDPHLRQAILSSPHGKRLAYQLAVGDPVYQESLKTKDLPPDVKAAADAKAVVEAASRQASISAAGTGQGTLDKAAVVANMTDEEFKVYKDKIIARAT
jgi:hypothetical protein